MPLFYLIKKELKKNRGLTLIEIIVYVALLALLMVIIISSLLQVSNIASETKAFRALRGSSLNSLGRMTYEIRLAQSTNLSTSIFDANPGRLKINTTDINSNPRTVEFKINGTNLEFIENSVAKGFLTTADVNVTSLIFRRQVTAKGDAIKIELILQNKNSKNSYTEKFYKTVVMRGAY